MKVFVSSTTKDLGEARKKVCDRLLQLDIQPVSMDWYAADDKSPKQLDDAKVNECDAFVIIVGHLYGSCPNGEKKSFTELEYEAAKASGKHVYPFLASNKFPIFPDLQEDDATRGKLKAFRKRLTDDHAPRYFDNDDKLCTEIVAAIRKPAGKGKIKFPLSPSLHNQTPPEVHFVGREGMLETITGWYKGKDVRIGALIGWGGVGKSALVRNWYDSLSKNKIRPDGIFWWDFYRNDSIEQFLNALLRYVSDGQIEPDTIKSTWEKVERIKEYIHRGRYLIILDGLEQMQKGHSGDEFGKMVNRELTELFHHLVDGSKTEGLCLITTRFTMRDLEDWRGNGYENLELTKLDEPDALLMLKNRGVKGSDEKIIKVIEKYKGHALSLTLLAGYLKKFYKGDIEQAPDIKFVLGDKKRFRDVNKLLNKYAEKMSEAERVFLNIFSLFRQDVTEKDFAGVFRKEIEDAEFNDVLAKMDELDFKDLTGGLVDWRLVAYDETKKAYSTHPLIKGYFEADFDENDKKLCHKRIYQYFGEDVPEQPETLDKMQPLFEQVYHGCAAGLYDEVNTNVRRKKIWREKEKFIVHRLGAWESALSIVKTFFPEGDLAQMPLVSKKSDQSWLLNEAGIALLVTGRTKEAEGPFLTVVKNAIEDENWAYAAGAYRNLADLQFRIGELESGLESSENALEMSEKIKNDDRIWVDTSYLAWISYLLGKSREAEKNFIKADDLLLKFENNHLRSMAGVWHAQYLLSMGKNDEAFELTGQNIEICRDILKNPNDVSSCQRCLGSIERIKGNHKKAENHLQEALEGARKVGVPDLEIEALLEYGRLWLDMERYGDAIRDAKETLKLCGRTGFRFYEPEAEIVLGKAYLVEKDPSSPLPSTPLRMNLEKAEKFAKSAYDKALAMKYRWAEGDAGHLLGEVYLAKGEKTEAREQLKKAIACRKEILDPNVEETEKLLNDN
ncbi:MAG: DUF4062 domain-containing protein [Planctomycetes bacterium]|nr:DUF4062 domain-containing protein [Planctomycetota bacterium]